MFHLHQQPCRWHQACRHVSQLHGILLRCVSLWIVKTWAVASRTCTHIHIHTHSHTFTHTHIQTHSHTHAHYTHTHKLSLSLVAYRAWATPPFAGTVWYKRAQRISQVQLRHERVPGRLCAVHGHRCLTASAAGWFLPMHSPHPLVPSFCAARSLCLPLLGCTCCLRS